MKNNLFLKYGSNSSKALMILLIMLIVVVIAQALIVEVSIAFVRRRVCLTKPPEDEIARIKKSSKRFMPDGTVHQIMYEENSYHRDDADRKVRLYDANDNLVWQGVKKEIPYQYLSWPEPCWSGCFHESHMHYMLRLEPDLSGSVEFPVRQDDQIKIIWRYLPDEEYFVAYDLEGEIAGYLGATGFAQQKTDVTGFGRFGHFIAWCPDDSANPVMLWQTDKKIYQIDFQRQIVETIFRSDKELQKRMSLKNWRFTENDDADALKYRPAIFSRTTGRMRYLIMRQPNHVFTFTPPADWNDTSVMLTATEDDIYLLRSYYGPRPPKEYRYSDELMGQWKRQQRSKPKERWEELYTVNEKGQLNLINRYDWTEPPDRITSDTEYDFMKKVKYCVTDFSPPVYSVLWRCMYKYYYDYYWHEETIFTLGAALIKQLRSRRIFVNCFISFVFVLIALWHSYPRRTSWLNLMIWLVVIALFGLAGFLTYWALNHTTLIKCPVCGKKRHLEQSKCVRCGADLPTPQRKPTDLIFAA